MDQVRGAELHGDRNNDHHARHYHHDHHAGVGLGWKHFVYDGSSSIRVTLDPADGTHSFEVFAQHSSGYPRLGQLSYADPDTATSGMSSLRLLRAPGTFYNDPQGISVGLIPTAEYYNKAGTLDGYFTGIIAAPDGEILIHIDPRLIGTDIEDLLGPAVRNATAEGTWITAEDNPAGAGGPETMRFWVIDVDGTLIGASWYQAGGDSGGAA